MLRRDLAPLSKDAWRAVDAEVRDTLKAMLTGRRVVDVEGPHGWTYAARNLGTLAIIGDSDGVTAGLREVQAVVEVRTPFMVPQMQIDTVDRGGAPAFDAAAEAAKATALCEDRAIFHGWKEAGIEGIAAASSHEAAKWPDKPGDVPEAVVGAVGVLHEAGVGGPYHLVLGTKAFQGISGATPNGVPVRRLLEKQLAGGGIHHSPAVDGAMLLSGRGGDFELSIGQDMAVGYASHDRQEVELYVTSSFTFRVLDGDAAIALS